MSFNLERRNRGAAIWFRDDIMDALAAVDSANWDVAQHVDGPEMRLYRKGYEAALAAVAMAFGLAYSPPSSLCAAQALIADARDTEALLPLHRAT
jgi:hypothetical protein